MNTIPYHTPEGEPPPNGLDQESPRKRLREDSIFSMAFTAMVLLFLVFGAFDHYVRQPRMDADCVTKVQNDPNTCDFDCLNRVKKPAPCACYANELVSKVPFRCMK